MPAQPPEILIPPVEELAAYRYLDPITLEDAEPCYTQEELGELEKLGAMLLNVAPRDRIRLGREFLVHYWGDDPLLLIAKVCWINTKKPGKHTLLKPNVTQQRLYRHIRKCLAEGLPIRVIILKARQLGLSTFIQALFYIWCYLYPNLESMVISYDKESTAKLFEKCQLIHSRMWFPLPTKRAAGEIMSFEDPHSSTMQIKTAGNISAGRSFTLHHLHCSEVPMWDHADEVLLGATNSVGTEPRTSIFLESTAKGAVGSFYDYWVRAEKGDNDYHPFFSPWFWDPAYRLPLPERENKRRMEESLTIEERQLREDHSLDLEQLLWRRHTIRNKCEGSVLRFKQEYPSTAQEAFITSGSPVFQPHTIQELARNARPAFWEGDVMLAS